MYAKVYNFKFMGLSEAKVAASFCSDNLGKKIVPFNIRSLNISIGQCGSVAINLKFETGQDLKSFETRIKILFISAIIYLNDASKKLKKKPNILTIINF